jgi:hypothetical protein
VCECAARGYDSRVDESANETSDYGTRRGGWWIGMVVIAVAVLAVFVVLFLVEQDQLSRGWAYAVIPVAAIAAAASRVLTTFKAGAESKRTHD